MTEKSFYSSLATVFLKLYLFSSLSLLKVRESKPQRNMGGTTVTIIHTVTKCTVLFHCAVVVCFCRGILISVGMSENKSYIVRQEVSLAHNR